jgi:tetratricopeptide (TPR) repeat protein
MADDPRELALFYFKQGYERQSQGDFREAIELYTRSIEAFPTAEAYTFRGWTHSFMGNLDDAIVDCMQAIDVDPEFGNPYNDIGAYKIEQGKWDEAIPWFEKAIEAKRYDSRCYAHFNMGRVYERKSHWKRAMTCYARAFLENQAYTQALVAFRRLQAMWN